MLSCGGGHGADPLQPVCGEKGEPPGQVHSHQPMEQLPQVLAEPLADKDIDYRVDAAVSVGDHLRHLNGQVQLSALLTLTSEQGILESRNKHTQIVGCPKEKEDDHDDKNQTHGLGLLLIWFSEQNLYNPCVADDHDQQRQYQAHDVQFQSLELLPPCEAFRRKMKTAGVVAELPLGLGKVQAGDRSQDGQDPDDNAGDDTKGDSPSLQSKHGMDDGQVPVDGQQDDEEDLAVQAHEIEPREQLAHGITENPVILHLVVDPEGQREEEDEVRNGQVEEVDAGHASEPLVLHEDQDHQDVADQANDKHHRI